MSMAEIMRELASLPPKRQNEVAAYLLHLRLQHDEGWRKEMGRRIDDKNPKNWVRLEDLEKSLGKRKRK